MTEIATAIVKGRPRKYSEYEQLYASLKKGMKRPAYVKNIGILRGLNRDSVYTKICLKHGGTHNGKTYQAGQWIEINIGRLTSFNWQQLEDRRDELQGKADRNESLESAPIIMFKDFADQWCARNKQRLKSYKLVKAHIANHLKPEFGDKAVSHIRTTDINDLIVDLLKKLKPATVKRTIDTLKAILNDAIKSKLILINPCSHADSIKGIIGRERFLSPEELVTLYNKAKSVDKHFADFLMWSVHSGMRRNEILSLKWQDIRELTDKKTIAIIRISKSNKSRFVTCTPTMKTIIENQKKRKCDDRFFPIAKMTLRRRWDSVREGAKIEDVTLHDLRRTHSTHLAASGVDLRTLAARLGHSDLTMLHKHYAVLVSAADDKALVNIEGLFGKIDGKKRAATTIQ